MIFLNAAKATQLSPLTPLAEAKGNRKYNIKTAKQFLAEDSGNRGMEIKSLSTFYGKELSIIFKKRSSQKENF